MPTKRCTTCGGPRPGGLYRYATGRALPTCEPCKGPPKPKVKACTYCGGPRPGGLYRYVRGLAVPSCGACKLAQGSLAQKAARKHLSDWAKANGIRPPGHNKADELLDRLVARRHALSLMAEVFA